MEAEPVPFSRLALAAALLEFDDGCEGRAQHSAMFTPFRQPDEYFTAQPSPGADSSCPPSTARPLSTVSIELPRPASSLSYARPPSALSMAMPADEPDAAETMSDWGLDEFMSELGGPGADDAVDDRDRTARSRVHRPPSLSLAATLAPVRFDDDEDGADDRPRRPSAAFSRRSSSFAIERPASPAVSESAMSVLSSGTRLSAFDPGRTFEDPERAEAMAERPRFRLAVPTLVMPSPLRTASFDAEQAAIQFERAEAARQAAELGLQQAERPAGKLYGQSLMDQLEHRKQAQRAKQRSGFGQPDRPTVASAFGPDEIYARELERLDRIRLVEAEAARKEDEARQVKQAKARRKVKDKAKPTQPFIPFVAGEPDEPFEPIELYEAYDDSFGVDDGRFRFPDASAPVEPESREDEARASDEEEEEDAVWPQSALASLPSAPPPSDPARPPTLALDLGASLHKRGWLGHANDDAGSDTSDRGAARPVDDEDDDAPIARVVANRRTVSLSPTTTRSSTLPALAKLSLGPDARPDEDAFGLRAFGLAPSPTSSEDGDFPTPVRARHAADVADDDQPLGTMVQVDDDTPLGYVNPAMAAQQQMLAYMAAASQQYALAQYAFVAQQQQQQLQGANAGYAASVLPDEDMAQAIAMGYVPPPVALPPAGPLPQDPSIDRWRRSVVFN